MVAKSVCTYVFDDLVFEFRMNARQSHMTSTVVVLEQGAMSDEGESGGATRLTMPSVFQSSSSLKRSVRFRKMIRCRRVSVEKSNMY